MRAESVKWRIGSWLVCMLALALIGATPAPAELVTGEFEISTAGGGFPSAAYDSDNHRYLVVWTASGLVYGRLVSDNGLVVGSVFQVSDALTVSLFPQIAYNSTNHEFLVTWDADGRAGGSIFGQLIDANTGARKLASDFPIITRSGGWRSSVDWSSKDNQYLVICFEGQAQVWGQLVYGGGGLRGSNFEISQTPVFAGYPAVSYGRAGSISRFLVTWDDNSGCILGRRVDALTGAILDATPIQVTAGPTESRSTIAYDSGASTWLVQSHSALYGSFDVYGRFVGLDGVIQGDPIHIADSSCFEGETHFGPDSACDPGSGRFFSVFQYECQPGPTFLSGQEIARTGAKVGGVVSFFTAGGFIYCTVDTYRHRFLALRDGTRVYGRLYGAAPGPVAAFSAIPGSRRNTLSWTNPTDAHYTGTLIVYRTDRYPASPTDGTPVVDKANTPGSTDTFTHTGLTNRTLYYYSAFAHDIGPNYSVLATAIASPNEIFRTAISTSTFVSGSSLWTVNLWKAWLEGTYNYGKMYWQGGAGNPDGCMRSAGDGSSDNTDPCTREGGEIKRTLSTAGYKNLLVSYDLRTGPLGIDNTGGGTGGCAVDHNLIDEQLTVFYSTDGGTNWNELEWFRRAQFLPLYQSWRTRLIDLSGIAAANNCSSFMLRFRWQFNNTFETGDYGDLDNVILSGELIRVQDAKVLPDGSPITLRNKVLCLRQNGFGYVEEQDRTTGIRIETSSTTTPGKLATVTGTMRTTTGGERYIQASSLSPGTAYVTEPLGLTNRDLAQPLTSGLFVTTWGIVTDVDPSGWFIISDGSIPSGIKVITFGAPGVTEGQFTAVTGAAGYDGQRVLYLKQ